jgi:hypothetical protein
MFIIFKHQLAYSGILVLPFGPSTSFHKILCAFLRVLCVFCGSKLREGVFMPDKGRTLPVLREDAQGKGGAVLCGHHEPLIFRRRAGAARVNEAERFAYEHSDEVISRLAARGITWIRTHFFKGFGLTAEAEEMALSRDFIARCHLHGIKVEIYTQWGTLQYETFLAEVPEMKEWATLDQHGEAYTIHYGHQDFRWIPCCSRPGYWEYYKKVLDAGLASGAGGFGFDNVENPMLPDICYCPECQKGFVEFLKAKYRPETPEGKKLTTERFGFAVLDHIRLPRFNVWNPPIAHAHLRNPVFQDWIDFRCENLRRRIEEIWRYVKSRKPEMMIEYNVYPPLGENAAFFQGIDMHRLLPWMDCSWNERPPSPSQFKSDGGFYHKVHAFKLAESYGNLSFTGHGEYSPTHAFFQIGLAEALAFNGGNITMLGYITHLAEGARKEADPFIEFRAKHPELYANTRSAARVGLVEHAPTLMLNCVEPHYAEVLAMNGLLAGQVPFDLVPELSPSRLSAYAALVLPEIECLSDAEAAELLRYIRNGGALVFTQRTGMFDEWRRRRSDSALSELLKSATKGRGKFGRGRFVCIEQLEPVRPFDAKAFALESIANRNASEYYPHAWDHAGYAITKEHWTLPRNQKEYLGALRWAAGDTGLTVSGPRHLIVEARYPITGNSPSTGKGELLLHLINYHPTKSASGVTVSLASGCTSAELFAPGSGRPKALKLGKSARSTNVRIGTVERYAVLRLSSTGK